jgi:hypothetical protein
MKKDSGKCGATRTAGFLGKMIDMDEPAWQDAEKARQLRSQLIEILNVPPRVRLRFRLACGLAGRPF